MVLRDGNKGGGDACTEIRFCSLSQIKSLSPFMEINFPNKGFFPPPVGTDSPRAGEKCHRW